MHPDLALDHLARRQYGCFSRHQARQLGFSTTQIRRRLASGRWLRLGRGVYCLASAPATTHRRYKAAELSAPGATVSGLAAAHVWQLPGCGAVAPEITVVPSASGRSDLARVRRRAHVARTRIDGLTVTTLDQTLVDVVPRLGATRLDRIFDHVVVERKVDVGSLADLAERAVATRRPGGRILDALVAERITGADVSESVLELEFDRLLGRAPDVPVARGQVSLPWWRRGRGRFDRVVPPWRLLVEVDGRAWHTRVQAFDDDRWRDNLAASNGFALLRFTARHLGHHGDEVLDLIRRTGARRAAA